MARLRREDLMQAYKFWLIDISPQLVPPFLVLGGPTMGFSGISTPEVSIENREVQELNSMWAHHIPERATASPITLSRGARADDDSLWTWVEASLHGGAVPYRNLLLVHSTGMDARAGDITLSAVGLATTLINPFATITSVAGADISQEDRRTPGRIWILWHCVPVSYKSGTDFDAQTGDVSIQEITIQPRAINEFALAKQFPF